MSASKRAISVESSSSNDADAGSPKPKRRRVAKTEVKAEVKEDVKQDWPDWPAPRVAMARARDFIQDIADHKRKVLLVPDKDADGLSAGYVLHHTLQLLGLPPSHIHVHVLSKGTNVHSPAETATMEATIQEHGIERVVVLDQGSRGGLIVSNLPEGGGKGLMVMDHHMSDEFPPSSTVLSACRSAPIATTSVLTYLTCLPLHPLVRERTDWAALVGVVGDLGSGVKWGTGPWPKEIGEAGKRYGNKIIGDAVSQINAPRRTAEYNVKKAWDILIVAEEPKEVAGNAWLKLCRLDVNEAIEKWGRQPPRFSADGKVALIRVDCGFQVHPVIATKWAGVLRKAKTLVMVMCANTGFNPDPDKVSFSCRISASLRELPEEERPSLIELLKSYGDSIDGFRERVGDDFARGHNEATGGIIVKAEFENLLQAMGIDENPTPKKASSSATKTGKGKVIDASQKNGIKDFFKASPTKAKKQES